MNNWIQSVTFQNWPIVKSKNVWGISNTKFSDKTKKGDRIIFYVNQTKNFCGAFEVVSNWHEPTVTWPDPTRPQEGGIEIDLKPIQLGYADFDNISSKLDFSKGKKGNALNFVLQNHPGGYANRGKPISDNDYEIIVNGLKNNQVAPEKYIKLENQKIRKIEKINQDFDMEFWLVGSGISKEREEMWNEFKNNNIVGVGWNKTGDVSNLSNKEIINKFKNEKFGTGFNSLIEFKKIKPKDIIFVNDGKQGFFGIGRAIGGYRFDTKYALNHHVIPVEWITTEYIKITKPERVPGNPNASCSRIVKNKNELMKYLNKMSKNPNETFSDIEKYVEILKKKKQIIFYGSPGTGKTHYANLLAKYFTKNQDTPTMTFRSAAIKVLRDKGGPMHYNDIWKKAFEQKLVETKGKTPAETLLACITADVKINGESSIFKKTDTGTYELSSEEVEELKISEGTESEKNQFLESVTFHPSYSYEDFIEGIKPSTDKGRISYAREDGIFKKICEKASADSKNKYVLLIDEINRGNISKIFGELITLIETNYREDRIMLAYSKESFSVPKNIFIIGTMNTADRSLVQIDTALRRRFAFVELMPNPEKLTKVIDGISLKELLAKLNDKIVKAGLREKQVGHTYLLNVNNKEELQFVFSYEIIPLLQDYFFNDYKKLQEDILSQDFIDDKKMIVKDGWKKDTNVFVEALKRTFEL